MHQSCAYLEAVDRSINLQNYVNALLPRRISFNGPAEKRVEKKADEL